MDDALATRNRMLNPAGLLFWLSASVGVAMTGLGIVWPLVPIYAIELGASGIQVGLIIASFNIARSLSNPVVGRLSDRSGRKRFLLTGLFLYGLVSVLYVASHSVEALIGVRLLHGFAAVFIVPVAMALVADIAPEEHLGLYMGTLSMAVMLGLGAGPFIGGAIKDLLGLRFSFYIMGALALTTCAGIWIFIPPCSSQKGKDGAGKAPSIRAALQNRFVQAVFIMRFFTAAGQGSVYTFLPLLAHHRHLSSSQVGIVLSINILLIAMLQRVCGRAADRMNPVSMMIAGIFTSGVVVACVPLAYGFWPIFFINVLMGAANGVATPGGLVISGHLGRRLGMGTIMSLNDSAWSLGFLVSPILSGLILDGLGMPSVFYIGGLLILAGSTLAVFLLRGFDYHKVSE